MICSNELAELRRRASANLVALRDGSRARADRLAREQAAARRARIRAERKERREERARLKAELREARKTLAEHEKEWKWLYDAHANGTLKENGDFGCPDIVVLEEVDAQRDALCERIVRLDSDLMLVEEYHGK